MAEKASSMVSGDVQFRGPGVCVNGMSCTSISSASHIHSLSLLSSFPAAVLVDALLVAAGAGAGASAGADVCVCVCAGAGAGAGVCACCAHVCACVWPSAAGVGATVMVVVIPIATVLV